jgi:hypothetical protein
MPGWGQPPGTTSYGIRSGKPRGTNWHYDWEKIAITVRHSQSPLSPSTQEFLGRYLNV